MQAPAPSKARESISAWTRFFRGSFYRTAYPILPILLRPDRDAGRFAPGAGLGAGGFPAPVAARCWRFYPRKFVRQSAPATPPHAGARSPWAEVSDWFLHAPDALPHVRECFRDVMDSSKRVRESFQRILDCSKRLIGSDNDLFGSSKESPARAKTSLARPKTCVTRLRTPGSDIRASAKRLGRTPKRRAMAHGQTAKALSRPRNGAGGGDR